MKDKKGKEASGTSVLSDRDFKEAHFDDKLFLFWTNHKNMIWNFVTLLMLCVIGFQGLKFYQQYKQSNLQKEYLSAINNNTLENFASSNSNSELGAYAYITLGDAAFEEKKYKEAEQFFLNALNGLKDPVLSGRAQYARAMCLLLSDSEGATNALKMIGESESTLLSIRWDAMANLCIYNIKKGDFESYKSNFAYLQSIGSGLGLAWVSRVENFTAVIPELSK